MQLDLSFNNIKTLKMIYFAYCHSLMKYGIIIWGNSTDRRKKSPSVTKENCENYDRD